MAKLLIRNEGAPVETLELPVGIHVFGRTAENDFQVCHPSVSTRHCEIEVSIEGMFVRDLASTNGTFLNEVQVLGEVQVRTGHTLRLGDVVCEVADASPEVHIPTWSAPAAIPLPDGAEPCVNHPAFPASMRCTECKRLFCGTCVHILRRSKGVVHKLCPICSAPCEAIEGMNVRAQRNTWLAFFKKTFRLPRIHR
jgi:hypothetical protein